MKGTNKLYERLAKRNITFNHVCEVGVYLPETSNILEFIRAGVRATLVEADPQTVERIETYFSGYDIRVFPVAIWDHVGTIRLSKAGASTFVSNLKASPALVNDHYCVSEENALEVPCCRFSDVDDGTIDLLSIDIEGAEWYVIEHMVSRPAVISIETHGKCYVNPFLQEIMTWLAQEQYAVWYKDKSDTVFIHKNFLKPSMAERITTQLAVLHTNWKKLKRNIMQ